VPTHFQKPGRNDKGRIGLRRDKFLERLRHFREYRVEGWLRERGKLGWTGAALSPRAKGGGRKLRIARRLLAETAVTLQWIAAELHLGTWTNGANRLSTDSAQSDNQPALNVCQK
jgi:hypothetical protein